MNMTPALTFILAIVVLNLAMPSTAMAAAPGFERAKANSNAQEFTGNGVASLRSLS